MLCTSCAISDEMPWPANTGSAEQVDSMGDFSLTLTGDRATRAITTIITEEEKKEFLITIYKGSEVVRQTVVFKNLNTSLPAGYGYTVVAENCTEYDAEHANGGWGRRRYKGTSASFRIQAGQTTPVNVGCSVANSAVNITFDESMAEYFTGGYNVTIVDGDRTLTFTKETELREAYFNIPPDGERAITYIITANTANGSQTITKEGTLDLEVAEISHMNLTYEPGKFDFAITVDEEEIFVDDIISITDDDITPDDGQTDANTTHDGYTADGTNIDIDTYE